MQSIIQKKSYNSVQVFWLNKDLLKKKISKCVEELVTNRPEVQKVVLFGSLIEDKATSNSDVDILIIVKESKLRFIDRTVHFWQYFKDVGLGVDLFIYTQEEIEENNIPLVTTALKRGGVLFIVSGSDKSDPDNIW